MSSSASAGLPGLHLVFSVLCFSDVIIIQLETVILMLICRRQRWRRLNGRVATFYYCCCLFFLYIHLKAVLICMFRKYYLFIQAYFCLCLYKMLVEEMEVVCGQIWQHWSRWIGLEMSGSGRQLRLSSYEILDNRCWRHGGHLWMSWWRHLDWLV